MIGAGLFMKYISLKQQGLDAALLHCVVQKLNENEFQTKYDLCTESKIQFEINLDMLGIDVLTSIRNYASEFMAILKNNVLTKFTGHPGTVTVKEYQLYPGKRKPYFATLSLPGSPDIDLLHVHYYQSSIDASLAETTVHPFVYENNNTIYYDVKKEHLVCYPIHVTKTEKKGSDFWVDIPYDICINTANVNMTLESKSPSLQRPEKFMQYYNALLKSSKKNTS